MGSLHGKIILFKDLTEIMHLRKQLRRREYFSAIGEMASWLAHEVRNPLFAIDSIARILLKKAEEDSEWGKFVISILKETGRLNSLISDLLHYGKPLELKLEMVKLNDHITEVVDGLRSFASESGSEIEILSSQSEVVGHIDKDRMKQVFYNIIKNSIDAGAGRIEIFIAQTGESITITAKDNGRGVKASQLENVFTPFFTTKKTGTGLGLAICRKIIEEHGGTISMDSIEGKGTKVHITLAVR
jgi:two-component system sensor histidine kinase HydH